MHHIGPIYWACLYVFITCIAAFVRNKLMMMMMIVGNEKLTGSQISLSVVDVKLAKNYYVFSDKCNRGGNMVFLIML